MHVSYSWTSLTVLLFSCLVLAVSADASPSNAPSNLLYDISSEINPKNIVRFTLGRTELPPSHLERRATQRPYTLMEPDLYPPATSAESVVQVPLTDIPRDYGYTAVFCIGTYDNPTSDSNQAMGSGQGSQLFNLLLDTGSDLIVVTSAASNDLECSSVRHRYDCSSSLTCAPIQNLLTGSSRWVQGYGDGTIANGTLVQDTLRFVSSVSADTTDISGTGMTTLQVFNQSILVVDQPGLHLMKSYGAGVDGIIGLNLRSPVISSTVVQSLQRAEIAGTSSYPISSCPTYDCNGDLSTLQQGPASSMGVGFMSLWLTNSLAPGQGGELLLNAVDKSRFQGPIRWVDRGPSPYDWSIPLDRGLLLQDTARGTTVMVPGTDYTFAVLDSGSDGIYLQKAIYDALFKQVPGAVQLKSGYWRVPCEGTTELVVGIQGELYRIPYEDWVKKPNHTSSMASIDDGGGAGPGMCQTKVYGSSPGPTLLGSTFLRSVYTVFDFSRPGYERMGFATLV
ncbi:aspartic peptidase domain-containing protein [Dissophora ornata]|nr:hypothetical protein BGZ58_008515 [Dissophora ornata]KAI8597755.1 aspartic peptidase domain-containing protein [Dissophora ornata]